MPASSMPCIETALDLDRRERQHSKRHSGMRFREVARDQRRNRHGGGYDAEIQLAAKAATQFVEFLNQRLLIGEYPLCPGQDTFAFPRQPAKALARSVDQRNGELALELTNGLGQASVA